MLRYPDGSFRKFRVRSLVGLIPLFAVERLEIDWIEPFKEFTANLNWFLKNRRDLVERRRPHRRAQTARRRYRARRSSNQDAARAGCSAALCDPSASSCRDYGIRSLSKLHEAQPFEFDGRARRLRAGRVGREAQGRQLELARADLVPDGFLLIESLRKLGTAFGPRYLVETSGSGGQPIALPGDGRATSPTA